ncbi:MAG: hypothetical protein ACK5MU_04110 [Candidatus Saccharimonadales bacterium]
MVDDNFYKIAWKMIDAVSAPCGEERILHKTDWLRRGIYCRERGEIVTPDTPEVHSALTLLARSGRVLFKSHPNNRIGITVFAKEEA